MIKLNVDIFEKTYNKNVYLLGYSHKKLKLNKNIYYVNKTLYLTSHECKYEINIEGFLSKLSKSENTNLHFKKVDKFTIYDDENYYAINDIDNDLLKLKIINDIFSDINIESDDVDMLNALNLAIDYNVKYNDQVIITNAFTIVLNQNKEDINIINGDILINNKMFSRCNKNEIIEILEI
jgi:hypothetical protein